MSIIDKDKVDGIAISKDGKTLVLLITDHLDWSDEYIHLIKLQEKINSYIGFLESDQYKDIYPGNQFFKYLIEIHFKHQISENCIKWIETANKQLSNNDIKIEYIVVD
ncbi:MAG: DUF6572 domain-containing protein [Burkholderiales bacterium]